MSYTIGDGIVTLALAGGIVGYLYVTQRSRQKRMEIIHQERMAAMEKGIPLPEFPLEPARERRPARSERPPDYGNGFFQSFGWSHDHALFESFRLRIVVIGYFLCRSLFWAWV